MGKILEVNGFRIYIYSNDHPPIHVHVLKGGAEAKVHLEPHLLIKDNYGFKSQELRQILVIIDEHYDDIKQKWHETLMDKETERYLQQLEQAEKKGQVSESYTFAPDTLDELINSNNLKIAGLHFHTDLDLMLIVLNNKKVIQRKLSDFPLLQSATIADLEAYTLSRYGVHWKVLDEDLSLKGFLQHELIHKTLVA